MSAIKETIEKLDRMKKALENQKRNKPGTYERYHHEILDYLRHKFPEEPESAIQEAAVFIAYRTAVVINDISAEMSREWEKAFYNSLRKE